MISLTLIILSFFGVVVCCLLGEQSVFSVSSVCEAGGGCDAVTSSDFLACLSG